MALNGVYAELHRIQFKDEPAQTSAGGVTPT